MPVGGERGGVEEVSLLVVDLGVLWVCFGVGLGWFGLGVRKGVRRGEERREG